MTLPFVHEWFAATAAARPDATAIAAGARTLTYRDLARQSNALAGAIGSRVPPGTLVGILSADTVQVITAMIASLQAGCAFVPMDPSNADARIATLVDEIDLRWWIADAAQLARLGAVARQGQRPFQVLCPTEGVSPVDGGDVDIIAVDADGDAPPYVVPRDPDSLCYIYFTSGSTGRPKGIGGRLKAIDHFIRWEAKTIAAGDGLRFSQLISPAFDAVLRDIFTPLCTGGTVCIPAADEIKQHAFRLYEWLRDERVNVVHCVPSVLRTLLQMPADDCRLPELRHVLTSGEALLPTDVQRWMVRFGSHARLTNLYGPSETTMIKFAHVVSAADAERPSVPIGTPIDGTRAIVVNEHGKVCPPGVVGEIYIRTPYRSLGYYGRPELTAEVFVQNPFSADPADLVYRTGDLGRVMEDGNFEFLGRRDSQVKIRGARVELAEVENALRRDPRVADVAVIDRDLEDGSKSLCAFCVLGPGLTTEALKASAGEVLPEYMVPSMFVTVDALPRTVSGKVERRALEAMLAAQPAGTASMASPRTAVEEIVAAVWARAFGVERVGIDDDFFQQLGGHSLLATQVLARLQPLFEVPLKLRWILERPTVAGLSSFIEQALRDPDGDGESVPPLERVSRAQILPAAFGQERLWVIDQVTGTRAYHMSIALRLTGELVPPALTSAVSALAARHESLRTTFGVVDGRPVQQIATAASVATPWIDLTALDAAPQERAQRRALAALRGAAFDLARGPLWRIAVLRLNDSTHVLSGVAHHIIADGWSLGVMTRDVAALYEAARTGAPAALPPLGVQYADYAVWQRRALSEAIVERDVDYWRAQLAGLEPLDLPADRPRPPLPSGRGRVAWRRWGASISAAVPASARAQGATTFMVLLAAWQVLLARYSGQRDVAVGVPITQRPLAELEPLIGLFLNTLVLRTRVSGTASWRDLVAHVRAGALAAYAHQTAPFERIIDALQPERDLTRTPLFQVLFVQHDLPSFAASLPGLHLDVIESQGAGAKFDLELGVRTEADGLTWRLEYAVDLFDRATADRMLAHLETLVAAAIADPDRPIAELPLLTAAERDEILTTWNTTATVWPDGASSPSLVGWLDAQAARTPHATAVIAEDATWTYAELHAHANQIAHRLRRLGVGAESRVAVWLPRSAQLVAALVAVIKAGGAYVPLDPSYPAARLAGHVADIAPAVVVTDAAHARTVPHGAYAIEVVDAPEAAWRAEATTAPAVSVSPEQLAYVIYTSGSTGQPKGAMNTQRGIANRLAWMQAAYQLTAADRVLQKTSSSFDVSVWEFFWPLGTGAAMVVARPGGHTDPRYLAALIARERVTVLHFVPTMLEAFVAADGLAACGSVRLIVSSGEALPGSLAARCISGWPGRLENLYGPTEAAIDVTAQPCTPDAVAAPVVPIGRPIANTQMYVLDRDGEPVPVGVRGDLVIGGVQVGRGYWQRPALTAERFVPDRFSATPGARLYRTGDLARYRGDGALEFLGRADHQVKLHGNRIELGEIEAALRQQPQIRDAAVMVREDRPGERRLVAYVVPASIGEPLPRDLVRQALRTSLPDYMVPAVLVSLDALPLTGSGKLDRRALPAPADERPVLAQRYVAPRNDVETALAEVWGQVLRLDRVGIHDNFFALGGDSILGLQALARARDAGVHLSPRQLFQHQTIADLALVAATANEGGAGIAAADEIDERDMPLTPIQRWFFEQDDRAPHHFNQSVLLAGGPALPLAAWEAIVNAVFAHHDALRLRFAFAGSEWRQRYALGEAHRVFMQVDLSGTGGRWRQVLEATTARVQRSLNLVDGPLARIVLFRGATQGGDRLFIVIHHAAIDGVSWRVLLEDLYRASAQVEHGVPVQLPGKTTSFRRWAERLQEAASALDPAVGAYWSAIDQDLAALRLPRDTESGDNSIGSQRNLTVALTEEETLEFLHMPPRAYRMQAHEVLIAAVAESLASWTGTSGAIVALEGHGRDALDDELNFSRTVGCFTTVFPVRLQLSGGTPDAVLRDVKEQLRSVPRRGLDYGLWRYLSGRAHGSSAMPDVLVNYLGQFDQVLDEAGSQLATERQGGSRPATARRPFAIELNGGITGNRLTVAIGYSANLHRPETVAAFADDFAARLRALIAHCRTVPFTRTTPTDVPLAAVTQPELDALVEIGGEIENVYPLSPMQEGLLFHALFDPDGSLYFQQVRVTLEGDLDVDTFRDAWADVVARHAILRTAFIWDARERPLQVAYTRVALECDVQDLRGGGPADRAVRLAQYVAADRARGFRLNRVPLMRVAVVRIEDRQWELIWSYHHILLDGWCVPLVFGEVTWLYEAHRARRPAALPPVARFSDYIAWLQSQDTAQAEAYWRRVLGGFREPTAFLPARDAATATADTEDYGRRERRIAPAAAAALHALGREHQVTVNTIVQGAWAVLLARYARTRDVVFGATSSGRPAALPGIESMVGLFISTLPVRVDVNPGAAARPWLRAIQDAQAEGRQYEYTPLVDIQNWSDVPGGVPLFDSLLAFENYPVNDELIQGKASFRIVGANVFEKTNYPVTVQVSPADAGLLVRMLYDGRRIDPAAVDQILAHTEQVLAGLAAGFDITLGELSLLSAAERAQIVTDWNPPDAVARALAAATPETMLERLERQAIATPDAIALVGDSRELSYAALHRRANQLAHVLREEGVGPDVRVAVCLPRSVDLVVALLGVWKAGGAYLPIDPQTPAARLEYLVRDAGAPMMVTTSALRDVAAGGHVRCVDLDRDAVRLAAAPADVPQPGVTSANLAYVIYTSGSTGMPKGVGVTHGNVASLFTATEPLFAFSAADTWTLFHSAAFDFSVWEMWGALAYGGRLIVVPAGMPRTPDAFAALIAGEGVTVLNQTPSAFRALQTIDTPDLALRLVIFGGEGLAFETVRPWAARHGLERPQLVNMYGITETTVHVTHYSLSAADLLPGVGSRIGRAIPSLQLYILDPALQPTPAGVAGEIYVGGAGVARGYLGRPELTATRFVPDPFGSTPGGRLYRTGDLARWRTDGVCEFIGRADQQVKVRGYRIELGEIDAALRDQPGIGDALVQLREDVPGEKRLVAYVVPAPDADAATADTAPRDWESRQVSQWEAVFERTYGADSRRDDPAFDITGWNSSVTGAPIPDHEMREWVDETVAEIAALKPSRVLEIGCGTGLLLLRLAPICEHYTGTDLSRTALDQIERQLASFHLADRVRLLRQAADDVAAIADDRYDVVILNSVVQYFPSGEYLARVLERAVSLVRTGGAIYIGDVRSLPLLQMFHASVQFQQAPGWLQRDAFERRVERQVHQEEELVIAPEFFAALADRLPAITHVEITPKRGRALNELTKFRYQAVLRVGTLGEPPLDVTWTDWSCDQLSLDAIAHRLASESPAALGVACVPNARLSDERTLNDALADGGTAVVLDELRLQVPARVAGSTAGVHPEDLFTVARDLPYEVTIDWTRHDAAGAFDVVFRRRDVRARWRGWPREIVARDAGASGTNSPSLGQAGRRIALDLRHALGQRLPSYMVPSAFVVLDRMPMTSNGKVDRKALPPPDFARPELEQAYVAPRTPLEADLARLWSDVLRVQQVGIHDNFFELGGDSIISIQIVARATHAGIPLTPRLLFERPTIAQIAAAAADGLLTETAAGAGSDAAIEPSVDPAIAFPPVGLTVDDLQRSMAGERRVEDAYPLSSMQEGMLFHTVSAPESGVYVAQLCYALTGDLDPAALRQAWQHTIDRHPALRTGFVWDRAEIPLQVVCANIGVPWEEYDWRGVPDAEQRARLDALMDADRARGFDLAAPPLMRLTLIRTAEQRWEVLWSHHHLLLDGWSLPIVTQDVVRSYAAFAHGSRPHLDAPAAYRHYIAWLREQDFHEAEQFWRAALRGVARPTPLPLAAAAQVRESGRAGQRSARVNVGARQTAAIKAWARAHHVTLNAVLQGLWSIVLGRLGDERDVVFGSVVSGRPPALAGSDRTVGLFINTLPVRVHVPDDDAELGAWLTTVQAQQAAQRQYEFVPLVKIRAWSAVPADSPLFETLLVFENFPREAFAGVEVPGLRVDGVQYHMTESHPLVLAVGPGAQIVLDLKYDRRRIEPSSAQRIGAMLEAALQAIASGGAARVGDLVRAMDRAERDRQLEDETLTETTAAQLLRTVKRAAVRRRVRSEVDDGSGTPTPLT